MTTSANVPKKRRLKNSTMHSRDVWGVTESYAHTCSWYIKRFKNLKKNVTYWNTCEELNCNLSITKRSSYYNLKISLCHLPFDGQIMCSVRYGNARSSPAMALRSNALEHEVAFPINIIECPQNTFLQSGGAVFDLSFSKVSNGTRVTYQPACLKQDSRWKKFVPDLSEVSAFRLFMDFLIETPGKLLIAHKSLLSARSDYFRQYITEKCLGHPMAIFKTGASSAAMDAVVDFMYTGLMRFPASKSDFIEIMQLSKFFGIHNIDNLLERLAARKQIMRTPEINVEK